MRRPAELYPPCEILADELKTRCMTPAGLGSLIVSSIMHGRVKMDDSIATALESVLGIDERLWINLETQHRQWISEKSE